MYILGFKNILTSSGSIFLLSQPVVGLFIHTPEFPVCQDKIVIHFDIVNPLKISPINPNEKAS